MELLLKRIYFSEGTLGILEWQGLILCFTIELPWRGNAPKISCIPEGRYALRHRYSEKFGNHLEVVGVPHRSFILLHPANDAKRELQGCIAPVSYPTGTWSGAGSKKAFQQLYSVVWDAIQKGHNVTLLIH